MTDVRTTSVQLAARGLTRHFSVRTPGAFFARSASCTRLMASVSTWSRARSSPSWAKAVRANRFSRGCWRASLPDSGDLVLQASQLRSSRSELSTTRRSTTGVAGPLRVNEPRAPHEPQPDSTLMIHGASKHEHRRWPSGASTRVTRTTEPLSRELPARTFRRAVQRISIARALCINQGAARDEPISMLDVSVRLGVLNLLRVCARTTDSPSSTSRTYCLGALHRGLDHVMYAGQVVEQSRARLSSMNQRTVHPTAHRVGARSSDTAKEAPPTVSTRRRPSGEGLRFSPRCPHVMDRARREPPPSLSARTTLEVLALRRTRCRSRSGATDAPEGGEIATT